MTTLLFDGDILLHETVSACKKIVVFDDIATESVDIREAAQVADHRIAESKEHFGADKVILAFSWNGPHWRQTVLPSYKEHRRPEKPLGFWTLRRYLTEAYSTECWEPLEGDDVLGILATRRTKDKQIVLSMDKDLRTIPGYYSPSWTGSITRISEGDADRAFMTQTLVGDKTDGYKGCPKVGKVNAKRLLDPLEELSDLWHAVVLAFERAGLGEEEALQQARVARILRNGEYDRRTKKVRLWTPPA